MSLANRVLVELVGMFWLVLGGCGSAVLAASFPDVAAPQAGSGSVFLAWRSRSD